MKPGPSYGNPQLICGLDYLLDILTAMATVRKTLISECQLILKKEIQEQEKPHE